MAIGLYCDESETAGKVFTLAGFMASPSGWKSFVPKWRQMLWRFFAALSAEMSKVTEMDTDMFLDLWYHLDAPED
jgi:hypothetical protein